MGRGEGGRVLRTKRGKQANGRWGGGGVEKRAVGMQVLSIAVM